MRLQPSFLLLRLLSFKLFFVTLFITQSGCATWCCSKPLHSHKHTPPQSPDNDFVLYTLGKDLPILTASSDLDQYVGKLVIIRGVVSNTKRPTINGVEIEPGDLSEQEAYAIGILSKFVYTKEAHEKSLEACRAEGNLIGLARRPGVYYTLYEDLNHQVAKARPVQNWYAIFQAALSKSR